MRVYIIGSDGITLCREAPTVVNDGEIAVASNEELHAAPLSGKRLLALWNALPGVEKRQKVGDRNALIDQWSAIELLPDPDFQIVGGLLVGHRQLGISRLTESAMGLRDAGDTHDYAAIATPVTWAQVAKAWVRPDPRFAAVSWSRRRGNTLAT